MRSLALLVGVALVLAIAYIGYGINRQADIQQRTFDLNFKLHQSALTPTPSP